MKLFAYISVLLIIIGISSCKETVDLYLGIPLQPDIKENNFEPGLNIIGVIRPDFTDTINNSFVHVQEVAPATNNYPEFTTDSMIVKEADVIISELSGEIYDFTYTLYDSLFKAYQYRPNSTFSPESGMHLGITCSYNNLPILTSETIVPNEPKIIESSIFIANNTIYFGILADTTTFLYDIYIFNNDKNTGYARIISNFSENTPIEIKLSDNTTSRIEVYGYDYNLASYYITSNTSLNFNKYRKTFGNVENGYGVFGSVNYVLHFMNPEEFKEVN